MAERNEVIRVCIAGATGWAGAELARAVGDASDLTLVSAVSRTHAGRILGDVINEPGLAAEMSVSVVDALKSPCDVLVEYTRPESAKANILTALEHGCHVVVGTSGLTDADFADGLHRGLDTVLDLG